MCASPSYYKPYDILEDRGKYGSRVVDELLKRPGQSAAAKAELAQLKKMPWYVWTLAEKGKLGHLLGEGGSQRGSRAAGFGLAGGGGMGESMMMRQMLLAMLAQNY